MIALGTLVKFTEVAYVVRKAARSDRWGTPVKGNYSTVSMVTWDDEGRSSGGDFVDYGQGRFLGSTQGGNKNVIALKNEGSGVVIGLERKLYGKSVGSGGGDEDFDPGWFEARGHVDLYVVKSELRGKPFYVPADSVEVLSS